MTSPDLRPGRPIGVGAVGVSPGAHDGLLVELPPNAGFELLAFSDEGLPEQGLGARPVQYYPDYNMLLQDPHVEVVLVDGPLELRRDMAVRALNAGRHVVLPLPFAETALGAERIMKTALSGQDLVATADCWWRDDEDLLALRAALSAADAGPVQGLFYLTSIEPLPIVGDVLPDLLLPQEEPDLGDEEAIEAGLLAEYGVETLDQLHLIAGDYVKSVSAHLLAPPAPGAASGAAEGFMAYLSLRGGGWAIAQATTHQAPDLPRWAVYTPRATVTARGGVATVTTAEGTETYTAPSRIESFWENLYAAVRSGAELKCSPVEIVRAMKLHEAAIESLGEGEPVTI
jgi:scyllo-inositol 2-dehydrogenase (NADP+)